MVSACVLIRTERGRFIEVEKRLKQLKGVSSAYAVVGRFDVVVDLEVPDQKRLAELVRRIGRQSGVVFTETLPELEA
jgi:uncharacterized protein with GYD domain